MRVVHQTCAGMDVHKRDVKVCLITRDSQGQRHQTIRSFSTMTHDVLALGDWLHEHGCTVVAMESTGVYWKPIFNLLEGQLTILLVNPAHIKQVPGRKTDVKDCQWIAELLEHGLLQGSFIPPLAIRDLRDLTRYQRQLVNTHSAEVNRLQKILEDANIKLASVATDVMGVSGRRMLQALLAGVTDPVQLAELAKGRLRTKKAQLQAALHGQICQEGFNPKLGAFVQSYGSAQLDASLLLMPSVGFLPVTDHRVRGTVAAIERALLRDGFVLRYDTATVEDGLPPGEGAFLACTFWLADCQYLLGRREEARATFERLLGLCNDVGLLAEEYDPGARRLVGNFPQAFSHVGLINTALNLSPVEEGPAEQRPQ
jgi:transposase